MKKFLLIGIIATALFACNTDKNDDPLILAYPMEVISVFPATDTTHLTPLQIVKEVSFMDFTINGDDNPFMWNFSDYDVYGREVKGIDTVNRILNLPPIMVYDETDTLNRVFFIDSRDVVLVRPLKGIEIIIRRDTIAYIPNAVMRKAAIDIRRAYKTNDRDQIRKVANQAYKCYAITGKEWRALHAQGKN